MNQNLSNRGSALLKLIHVIGACVAVSFAAVGFAQMGGEQVPCSDFYSITCAQPCHSSYIRDWTDCCNTAPGGCCKRKCTASICVGPPGASCASESLVNEWEQGTFQMGKICDNNICRWP
ncbi:MAG: hypothetical protein ABL962_05295 [Fimbriimonadaceae bacterium]